MLRIGSTVITTDLLSECFRCDLSVCMGNCCRYGDAGAPLTDSEVLILKEIYPLVKPYMRKEGIDSVESQGTSIMDIEGDNVTPLIGDEECAYTVLSDGILKCAIEKAWDDGITMFRKPLSCHLFPVRIRDYESFTAVNYERWPLCSAAIDAGRKDSIPLYEFLRDALVRAFGEEWYNQVVIAAKEMPVNF